MKINLQTCVIVVLSCIIGLMGYDLFFCGAEQPQTVENPNVEKTTASVLKTKVKGDVKKVTEISLIDRNGDRFVQIVESEQIRPGAKVDQMADDVDEEDLTEAQKTVLKELQDALDDNDLRRVRRALSKFVAKADRGGLEGQVPVCMRARAVEALGWFGKDAAVDLIGFIADSNEDVSNDAFSQFEQALSDCEMGDRARAELLTSTMKVFTDPDQIDSLLNQLNDMRNSVKAQAAKDILAEGTDVAKAKMTEQLESYFSDEVLNADGIDRWQAMNPDDPGDAEMYGGSK